MFSIFVCSCIPQKKLASICAEKFPSADSSVVIEKVDTAYLYKQGDSIFIEVPVHDTSYIKDSSSHKQILTVVTKTIHKTIYKENKAKIKVLEVQNWKVTQNLKKLSNANAILEYQNKRYKKIQLYIVISLVVMSGLFLFRTLKSLVRLW